MTYWVKVKGGGGLGAWYCCDKCALVFVLGKFRMRGHELRAWRNKLVCRDCGTMHVLATSGRGAHDAGPQLQSALGPAFDGEEIKWSEFVDVDPVRDSRWLVHSLTCLHCEAVHRMASDWHDGRWCPHCMTRPVACTSRYIV